LCPSDHAFIYAFSYFSKTIILATSPLSYYFICPRQEPRFTFETKLLSKLSIYKIIGTYRVEWSHNFTNLNLLVFIKGFQTPLRKLSKGDVMSPLVSKKFYKSFTPFFENSFLLDHGMIIIEHLFNHSFWSY
jgi:hypothetical protein